MIATSPNQSHNAEGFVPVDAVLALEQGHPFKAVRVRASENAVEVRDMPGSKQAAPGVSDCKDCLGKKFVATSEAQSATPGSIRQQDLPKLLRVIMPSDGIRGAEQNPNRLTLMLSDDHTIEEAFWE